MAIKPVMMKVIPSPLMPSGTLLYRIRSRIAASAMIASAKPRPLPRPKTALSPNVKQRLAIQAANRLDADGNLVVTAQRSRNQLINLRHARAKLAALVRMALVPPRPRIPTRPSTAMLQARLAMKRRLSLKKRNRRPVDLDD